jgi:rSAM/selenodomain-associated transferase 2
VKAPEISIIIPVANESEALPETLATIGDSPHETIVVDAQSEDETAAIARRFGCRLLSFPERHRARQMNFGAAAAEGRILLFLHADTHLPSNGLAKILRAIDRDGAIGGGFARRYRSRSVILALTCRLAELRNYFFGWHLGDQALFVRRDGFEKLGGYREIPIFEDLDFSRRLRRAGPTKTLRPPVVSSARRFAARGPLRTTLDDLSLTRRYFSGVHPNELSKALPNHVKTTNQKTYEYLP